MYYNNVRLFKHGKILINSLDLGQSICELFIASNRQGASILDFTQGEKHSIPVAASL